MLEHIWVVVEQRRHLCLKLLPSVARKPNAALAVALKRWFLALSLALLPLLFVLIFAAGIAAVLVLCRPLLLFVTLLALARALIAAHHLHSI